MSSEAEEIIDILDTNFSVERKHYEIVPEPIITPSVRRLSLGSAKKEFKIEENNLPKIEDNDGKPRNSQVVSFSIPDNIKKEGEFLSSPPRLDIPKNPRGRGKGRRPSLPPSAFARWTKEEDEMVLDCLKKFGYGRWDEYEKVVKTRTGSQIKSRVRHMRIATRILDDNYNIISEMEKIDENGNNGELNEKRSSGELKKIEDGRVITESRLRKRTRSDSVQLISDSKETKLVVNTVQKINSELTTEVGAHDSSEKENLAENEILTVGDKVESSSVLDDGENLSVGSSPLSNPSSEDKDINPDGDIQMVDLIQERADVEEQGVFQASKIPASNEANAQVAVDENDQENSEAENVTPTYDHKILPRFLITSLEIQKLPEWFPATSKNPKKKRYTKTPQRYLRIRNFILDSWEKHKQMQKYLTKVYVRSHLTEGMDHEALTRMFEFLEDAGFINVGVSPNKKTPRRFSKEGPKAKEFKVMELKDAENLKGTLKVKFSKNVLFLLDLHANLFDKGVYGLLVGQLSSRKGEENLLLVDEIYPGSGHLSEELEFEIDPSLEIDARKYSESKGLNFVGWYHSHPKFPSTPTKRDVDTQELLQIHYNVSNTINPVSETTETDLEPVVGVIISPYDKSKDDSSTISCFHLAKDDQDIRCPYEVPIMNSRGFTLKVDEIESFLAKVNTKEKVGTFSDIKWVECYKNEQTYFDTMLHSLQHHSGKKVSEELLECLKKHCLHN